MRADGSQPCFRIDEACLPVRLSRWGLSVAMGYSRLRQGSRAFCAAIANTRAYRKGRLSLSEGVREWRKNASACRRQSWRTPASRKRPPCTLPKAAPRSSCTRGKSAPAFAETHTAGVLAAR
eukprot:6206664-Pleurochrysis_carterae.AAC.1